MLIPAAFLALQAGGASQPMPRFEDEIRRFEQADRKFPPAPGAVLFVGSSSIRMWSSLARDFPEYRVLNRGFGGSWMDDSARLVDRIVAPYRPSAIVLYAGTNDLADGHSPDAVAHSFRLFVSRVRRHQPQVPIAFVSISPAPSRWNLLPEMARANNLIRAACENGHNVRYIDIVPLMKTPEGAPRPELFLKDQLHMNAQGYAIWTPAVRQALRRMIPPARARR